MDSVVTKLNTMKGFNASLVIIIYLGIALFASLLILYRYVTKMKKRKVSLSESHFEDSQSLI